MFYVLLLPLELPTVRLYSRIAAVEAGSTSIAGRQKYQKNSDTQLLPAAQQRKFKKKQ
jgi:hypothetical protein